MQWFSGIHKISQGLTRCLITTCLLLAAGSAVAEQKALVVGTWGGAYEKAQQHAWFQPFTTKTNIPIKTMVHKGGLDILLQDELPDVIDMGEADARRACDKGLLEPLGLQDLLTGSQENESLTEDFMQGSFSKCAIAHSTAATLVAYNPQAFLGKKPQSIADFSMLKAFQGSAAYAKNHTTFWNGH